MAVSGSEKTRIGGQLSGVGIKQTFAAKATGTSPTGRVMSSLANYGGLAGKGGIAGRRGGLAR